MKVCPPMPVTFTMNGYDLPGIDRFAAVVKSIVALAEASGGSKFMSLMFGSHVSVAV